MKNQYIELKNLECDSKTIIDESKNPNRNSLWNSSFNPTLSNDILSQPLTDYQKELETIEKE